MGMVVIFLLIAVICVLVYINCSLRIIRLDISNERLPAAFDGYRIVLMSDLHDKHMSDKLLYQLRELEPDMVAMAGDMHSLKSMSRSFLDLTSDIKKLGIPVYFVEGNHDIKPKYRFEHSMFIHALSENGVTVLHDATPVPVIRNNEQIFISGVGWFDKRFEGFGEGFHIFLKHSPLDFDTLPQYPQIMLCGHVHGGYIELPGIGAVFAPGNNTPIYRRFRKEFFRPKYYKGVYHKNGCDLVVSRGLGNSVLPFRLIKPEITFVTLKKKC